MKARQSRIRRNMLSLTAMRLAGAGFTVVLFWVIAREAGAEALGEYATVMTVFLFAQQFPLLGLHLLLIRDVAADPSRGGQWIAASTRIALTFALMLAAALAIAGASVFDGRLHTPLLLVGLSMIPTAVTLVAESVLTAIQNLRRVAIVNVAEACYRFLTTLTLLWLGFGLEAWLAAFLFGRLLSAGAYWSGSAGQHISWRHLQIVSSVRRYLGQAPIFLAILAASTAIARLDLLLLSWIASFDVVGQYAVATKAFELAGMASSILVTAMYPMLAAVHAQEPARFRLIADSVLRWLLAIGLPVAAVAGLVAEPIVRVAFGEQFGTSILVIPWLMFAAVLMAASQIAASVFLVEGAQALDLIALLVGCVAMVAFLLAWGPAYGAVGAGWAVFGAHLLQLSARLLLLSRQWATRAPVIAALEPAAAFAAAAGVWWVLAGANGIIQLVAAMCVYVSLLRVFGIASPAGIARLRAALQAAPNPSS